MTSENIEKEVPAALPEVKAVRADIRTTLFQRTESFCSQLLSGLPELKGVAVVPVWDIKPEKMPPGLLKLRNPNPPYVSGLLQLLDALGRFGIEVNHDMQKQLEMIEKFSLHLSNDIKAKMAELEALQSAKTDAGKDNDPTDTYS